MKTLKFGDQGPLVELLQTALKRAGFAPGTADGIFGVRTQTAVRAFQRANALAADGIAGPATHRALTPWYLGYMMHTVRTGDTLYTIARTYGSTLRAVETANPNLDPLNLRPGMMVVVPLPFPVVPEGIRLGSTAISFCCRGIAARYPYVTLEEFGRSVMGKPLYSLTAGYGGNRVFYNASHHANEWITTPVLLKFFEELARAYTYDEQIAGISARKIFEISTVCIAPAVNPDGIDLVTGELREGAYYREAQRLASNYPDVPFPAGWKANIRGVDLNLQYPAGWDEAREIKFEQGYTQPGPRDFVGAYPLEAPESRAMFDYTLAQDPALILAYHTQGEVIYWRYLMYNPTGAREIAERFSELSGYAVEDTPYASGFAGYKDWFIENYDRPGYTIEAGLGENPLPVSQFAEIYRDNIGILAYGTIATA